MNVALRKKIKKAIGDLFFSKRQNGVGVVNAFGLNLYIFSNQEIGRKIALGLYERKEIDFLGGRIESTDVCLDIGANIGYYTFLFASKASRVISVEPVKRNAKLIELTAAINNLDNVVVRNCLASNTTGHVEFTESGETSLSGISGQSHEKYLKDQYAESSFCRYPIESITVDSLELQQLDIVKIDVEGAELKVLLGMKQTLARLKPRLLMIEVVDSAMELHGDSIKDLLMFMASLNYKPFILQDTLLAAYTGQHVPNDNLFFLPQKD